MESPPNLVLGAKEDPQSVLKRVFIEKTMKAVITSPVPEDALVFQQILKFVFQCSIGLTPWSNSEEVGKEVDKWIQWNPSRKGSPNILVTFNKMLNGFDIETVITLDDVKDYNLGDVASRATNQFIFWRDLRDFMTQSECKFQSFLQRNYTIQ